MIKITRDLVNEVRAMMERHWDVIEIAHKLGLNPDDVRMIIEVINQLIT